MRSSFITSSPDVSGLPAPKVREVAFLGRSNVGKSSLLNVLAGAKIARTSKTPGRTQLINLFEVVAPEGSFTLADLPGYGFADVPKAIRVRWKDMISGYLANREALAAALLLIDVRRGVEDDDRAALDHLTQALEGRGEVVLVGTKIDKLPKAKQKPALHQIASDLGVTRDAILGVSADTRQGIDALKDRVWALVGRVGSADDRTLGQKSLDGYPAAMRRPRR